MDNHNQADTVDTVQLSPAAYITFVKTMEDACIAPAGSTEKAIKSYPADYDGAVVSIGVSRVTFEHSLRIRQRNA